jgi:hypothetical protein
MLALLSLERSKAAVRLSSKSAVPECLSEIIAVKIDGNQSHWISVSVLYERA